MAVGPFLTHDDGFLAVLDGTFPWTTADHYAVLLASGSGTQNVATEIDWEDISAVEITDVDYTRQVLASESVTDAGSQFKFTCGKITFTAAGDITARYLYILEGTAASPANADKIIGHVDLTGTGNASSIGAEFSFTPHTDGLFYVSRTAAP